MVDKAAFLEQLRVRLEEQGLLVEDIEVVEGYGGAEIVIFLKDGSVYLASAVRQPDGTHRVGDPRCVWQAVQA